MLSFISTIFKGQNLVEAITVNSNNEGKLLVKFQTIILFEKEKGSNLPKSELAEQIKLLFEEKGKRAKMTEELPLRDFSIIFLPMKFEPSDVKRNLKLTIEGADLKNEPRLVTQFIMLVLAL